MRSDRRRLTSVFGSYAALDAHAAFWLATACGVDILVDLLNVIVEGLDSEPLFAAVMERFASEPDRHGRWAFVLAEFAQRSYSLAFRLALMPLESDWQHRIRRKIPNCGCLNPVQSR